MARIKLEKTIKNNLGQILKERKMTAEDLAQKIKTTPATISRFKNLKTNLSMDSIVDITQALNITIGELFGEVPPNYKDIINIRYIKDINRFSNCEDSDIQNNFVNRSISSSLLADIGILKISNIIITSISNNSMYDTISPIDYVMIDMCEKKSRTGWFIFG